jgi:dipeptidyl aminopeptidase/acylaminoacyl peptidase
MRYRGYGRTGEDGCAGKRRTALPAAFVFAALLLVLTGCAHPDEEVSIPPLPAAEGRSDPGLGPGARPISSGPGYKSSPSWAPQGGRVAFTMDGYVVDRSMDAGNLRRWTTRDFGAEEAEWTAKGSLAILGVPGSPTGEPGAPRSLYRAASEEGSYAVEEIATGVRAMSPDPEAGRMVVAFEISPRQSGLALLRPSGEIERVFTGAIGGVVTGICPSPDGQEAVLAVRAGGPDGPYDLHVFDLRSGEDRRVASLGAGQEIFGAPQWTGRGIYFVAGERGAAGETALHDLYRLPQGPGDDQLPEPAPGLGEDFVAASIRVSPDGERLAVIGRLNPTSPINLYVLDLETKDLKAVTTNEDMEIKTGPDDLDWSPGGDSVAIVARGVPSGEPSVRGAPAEVLLEDFYNLYEIPVGDRAEMPR